MEDGRNAELDALRPQRVVVERAVDTERVEPVRETTTISDGSITEGARTPNRSATFKGDTKASAPPKLWMAFK